jgi:dTDP-4-amino-4,6-dideoxygalactose transaminase
MTATQNAVGNSGLPVRLGGTPAVTVPLPHFRWPLPDAEAERDVVALLRNGELSYFRLSGKVQEFEEAFRRDVGHAYAVSTHSGTGAIHAGWFALNLPPGSEVIVPAYTHIGTVMPLFHLGLVPVLCDIDPASGNVDPAAIRRSITARTRAIGVTHQFGLSARMTEIMAIALEHKLPVLEDCSHAHGARYHGQPVGTLGNVACFSLQANKTVPVGEGGILVTSDPAIAERAALLGHYRQKRDFSSAELEAVIETGFGMKSRLHPLAAAIGVVALRKMPEVIARRRVNYALLTQLVAEVPGLNMLDTPDNCDRGGFFRFVLKLDADSFAGLTAAQVVAAVQDEGAVEAKPGSLARCLHSYRIFQDTTVRLHSSDWVHGADPLQQRPVSEPGDFPHAEAFSASTVQLPAFTLESAQLIREYVRAFAKVQAHARALADIY